MRHKCNIFLTMINAHVKFSKFLRFKYIKILIIAKFCLITHMFRGSTFFAEAKRAVQSKTHFYSECSWQLGLLAVF